MTTFARGRRPKIGFESFVSITDVAVASITKDAVVFDGDLSEQESADVWALLESMDDADMETRANLRADRDALDPADPLRRLYCYVLGETP